MEPVLVWVFVVVDVLSVFAEVDVPDVVGWLAVVAELVVLAVCFEPPQPAIATAAINTPES